MQQKNDSSEIIIRGELIGKQSYWNASNTLIYTDNYVLVDAVFKGLTLSDTIVVKSIGGTVGSITHTTSTLIEYEIGDYGVFFIDIESNGTFVTYASQQGFLRYNGERSIAICPFFEQNVELLEIDLANTLGAAIDYTIPNYNLSTFSNSTNNVCFSPSVIPSGTGEILKITGVGFGTAGPSATDFVAFPDANNGGAPIYYEPALTNYLNWSDTLIELIVPTRAGTGPIKIEANSQITFSIDTLIVPFSILNINDENIPYLYNNNGAGGRTWSLNVSLFGAAGQTSFEYGMDQWKCATGINWSVSPTSTFAGAAGIDGIDLVFYGPLSAGVLGLCHTFSTTCNGTDYYIIEQDIEFTNQTNWYHGNGPVPISQFDFISTALHELGHAHVLGHVMDQEDAMYYASSIGTSQQVLEPYNVIAGNYVMDYCTGSAICGTQAHIQNFPSGCSHPSATDIWLFESSDLPNDSTCMGITPITIDCGNYGADPVTDLIIDWSVNGLLQTSFNWSGNLLTGETLENVFLGNYNLQDSIYIIQVWVTSVNGGSDYLAFNDSIQTIFTPVPCTPDDASVILVTQFDTLGCYDNQDISFTLINEGENNLTSCWVYFSDGAGTIDSLYWTGNLLPGESTATLPLLNYDQFSQNNQFTLWTKSPNGVQDTYTANDTNVVSVQFLRLKGTYTIGGVNPDFALPQDAFNHLNTYGTCGNVTLNIRPGVYDWAFELESIYYNSISDSILIQSETQNVSDVTLRFIAVPNIGNALLLLSDVRNVQLKYMTFDRNNTQAGTSTFSVPNIWIGKGAENIAIDSCVFSNSLNSQFVDNVYIQSARNNLTYVQNVFVRNNLFINGSRGVRSEAYLASSLDGTGLKVFNNRFVNIIREDIVLLDFEDIEIAYNYSDRIAGFVNVPSVVDIQHSGNDTLKIHHNTMLGRSNSRIIRVSSPSNSGNEPVFFYNNSVSQIQRTNSNTASMDLIDVKQAFLVNNSFYSEQALNQTTVVSKIIYSEVQDSIVLYNNQFVFNGAGYIFEFDNNTALNSDHNNFYNEGAIFARIAGGVLADFNLYKQATGQDDNSTFFDPVFISDTLLIPTIVDSIDNNAVPWIGITDDILFSQRDPIEPDMGSHEFSKPPTDLVMLPFSNLLGAALCPDQQEDLFIDFTNYGMVSIDSFEVYVNINASTFDTVLIHVNLAPFDTVTVFVGNYAIVGFNPIISLNSNMPNGIMDSLYQNNDFEFIVNSKLSGEYTVGGLTADFQTIQGALVNLHYGICDSVTFNINPGFYNNWSTLGPIPGNIGNTAIIFQSNIPDTGNVVVSSNTITGRLEFQDVHNLTFRHINFEKNGSANSPEMFLYDASNLNFDSCYFGPTADFESDSWSNGANGLSFTDCTFETAKIDVDYCDNFLLKGCKFYGDYGFVRHSSSNSLELINNEFNVSQQFGNAGIDLYYCTGPIVISENRINTSNQGLSLTYAADELLVKNNFIISQGTAIYSANCADLKVYNNSFLSQGNALICNSTSGLDYRNNIVKLLDSNYAYILGFDASILSNVFSDNNLYYGGQTNKFATINGADFDFNSWQASTTGDFNSLFGNPFYFSNTDLHTNAIIVDNAGTSIPEVAFDIDGELRDLSFPDIGADEFTFDPSLFYDIALIDLIQPNGGGCELQDSIIIVVENNLDTVLTSFTYQWNINGGTMTTGLWTGSIPSGQSTEVFISNYAFLPGEFYQVLVQIDLPNNLTDSDPSNSSVSYSYYGFEEVQILGDSSFCVNDSIQLFSSIPGFEQLLSWSNGGAIDSTLIYLPGSVVLNGTDIHGCTTTDSLSITLFPAPVPILIQGDTLICPGTSLDLTAYPILIGNSYSWSTTLVDTSQVSIINEGVVSLVVTNQDGCTTQDSHTIQLSDVSSSFTVAYDTVLVSDFTGLIYQWYLDGIAILGATNDTYVASQTGVYSLLTTNTDGCEQFSLTQYLNLDNITIGELNIDGFKISPNPSSGMFSITLPTADSRVISIQDIKGKELKRIETTLKDIQINLIDFATGIYFISISDSGSKMIMKID